ncbi:MAG: hypothetical protein J4215_00985 [Candidatus Diapherotrites archaeon]|uniref:Uncharacterized protein n=1 Tax=Candidatus Iainarchaeum sp. TaxID=3101447 RepID=A0A8T4L1C2_9ARCH|nr:hypothetical protein [Candidatus Diapherotrites archaeon]
MIPRRRVPLPGFRLTAAQNRGLRVPVGLGQKIIGRAANSATIQPGRFGKGMDGLVKSLKEHQKQQGQKWAGQERHALYDPAREAGLGRKTEARVNAIEEQRLASSGQKRMAAVERRIGESPHREAIEFELEKLQEFLEHHPNVTPEAVGEYLESMFNSYFPPQSGSAGYGRRYNNRYCAIALTEQFLPDENLSDLRSKLRKVA